MHTQLHNIYIKYWSTFTDAWSWSDVSISNSTFFDVYSEFQTTTLSQRYKVKIVHAHNILLSYPRNLPCINCVARYIKIYLVFSALVEPCHMRPNTKGRFPIGQRVCEIIHRKTLLLFQPSHHFIIVCMRLYASCMIFTMMHAYTYSDMYCWCLLFFKHKYL